MTDEQIALARRAVACRGWRWMHGMSNSSGEVIDCVDVETGKAYYGEWDADMNALPNLTDPATLGCLLALVREAYGDHRLACVPWRLHWAVDRVWRRNGHLAEGATEAEALVAALEAAPCGQ